MANTNPYLTFSSSSSFTLATKNSAKNWDGTLEYSTDLKNWIIWGGTTIINSSDSTEHVLYVRGTENSYITGGYGKGWTLTGSNISCSGNIENLLNHETVTAGEHPSMSNSCYYELFSGCTNLTTAPELPATTLAQSCYYYMFRGCTSLTTPPVLPATTLADSCYRLMFSDCTNLTTAPELPATTLADSCYLGMFNGCQSLTTPPELPATTLAESCYWCVFKDCTSLTTAPELPATTLARFCYYCMFQNCTSLIAAPELSATILARYCYYRMFKDCTSLTTAPELPATTLVQYCYEGMFEGCMSIKLSATKTNEYGIPYRVPSYGDGTGATNALTSMFDNTGGTFTGTPEINRTYYLYGTPKYIDSINLRRSVKYLKHSNLASNLSSASSNSIPTVKAIRDYRELTTEQYNTIANLLNLSNSSGIVSYITPTEDVVVDIEIDEKLLNVTHKEIINDIAMAVNNNELATSSTTRKFLSLTNEQYNTLIDIINR